MSKQVSCARSTRDPSAGSRTEAAPQRPSTADPGASTSRGFGAARSALPISPALRAQQARQLAGRLKPFVAGSLKLTVTDNRAVMLSVQRDPRRRIYTVRLHHLFADAPEAIVHALARYIVSNEPRASAELNDFIDARQDRIRAPQERRGRRTTPLKLHTRGRVYDLQAIMDELNRRYFGGRVSCRITWGRDSARRRPRRSIRVGSYHVEESLIRVHPGLDRAWVPPYYLRWVVYHEMLHAVHPIPVVNGRRRFHTPEFARDERRFDDYDRATTWEQKNIAALLCI